MEAFGALEGMIFNHAGQLGDGTTTNRNTPTMIISSGVAQVACGHKHTLGPQNRWRRSLWSMVSRFCWTGHGYGQLGNGNTTNQITRGTNFTRGRRRWCFPKCLQRVLSLSWSCRW